MLAVLKRGPLVAAQVITSAKPGGSRLLFTTHPSLLSLPPSKRYFLLRHAGTALQNPVPPEWPELSNKSASSHGQKPLWAGPGNECLTSALNSFSQCIGPGNQSGFHGMADRSWWLASMERTSPIPSHTCSPLPLDEVWQWIISLWG